MSLLLISNLSIRLGGRLLLDEADLTVDPGRRIGLVGRNGAGKSTLLKALSGNLIPDGGEIRLAARARMAQVKQEAPSGELSLIEIVLQGDEERLALLAEVEAADPHRLAEVHDRLRAIAVDGSPASLSAASSTLAGDFRYLVGSPDPGAPLYAASADQFRTTLADMRRRCASVLVQEFVRGTGAGYFALMRQGTRYAAA